MLYIIIILLLLLFHHNVIINRSDIDCIFMYVASGISINYDENESSATHLRMWSHWVLVLIFNFQSYQLWCLKHLEGVSRVGRSNVESGWSSDDEDCVDFDEEAGPDPERVSTIVLRGVTMLRGDFGVN